MADLVNFWKIAEIPSKIFFYRPTSQNSTKFGLQYYTRAQISLRSSGSIFFMCLAELQQHTIPSPRDMPSSGNMPCHPFFSVPCCRRVRITNANFIATSGPIGPNFHRSSRPCFIPACWTAWALVYLSPSTVVLGRGHGLYICYCFDQMIQLLLLLLLILFVLICGLLQCYHYFCHLFCK